MNEHIIENPGHDIRSALYHRLTSTATSEPLPLFCSLDKIRVRICDFDSGTAQFYVRDTVLTHRTANHIDDIEPGESDMPTIYQAPELILDHVWSSPVDVWAVGCMVCFSTASNRSADV
jgi:hypothetical protein